jgi:amino acid permease
MSQEETESSQTPLKVEEPPTGIVTAIFVLVNASLGDGLFGSPLAFAKAGYGGGIAIMIVTVFFAYLTFYYLVDVADLLGVYSYGDVCSFFLFFRSHSFVFAFLSWLKSSSVTLVCFWPRGAVSSTALEVFGHMSSFSRTSFYRF